MRSVTHSVETASASIRLREAEADGPPALLLHGGPGGTDYLFKFFAVRLRDAGYRAVGMIQRGSEGSPSAGPFTVEAMIDDVEAVRTELGVESVFLVGHSWGGFLAGVYAARHTTRVSRLVQVCPIGPRGNWRADFDRSIDARLTPEVRARVRELREATRQSADPEERKRLVAERARLTFPAYYAPGREHGEAVLEALNGHVYREVHRSIDRWYQDPEWEHGLHWLPAPAHVIYGLEDPLPRTAAEDWRRLIPHAELHPLADCGHFPWMETPEPFWKAFEAAVHE